LRSTRSASPDYRAGTPTAPRPHPRPCPVLGCVRVERIVWVKHSKPKGQKPTWYWARTKYCSGHAQRRERYGSYTARLCVRCRRVVDDEQQETHIIGNSGGWLCNDCLGSSPPA
jgi:hypothetical protein